MSLLNRLFNVDDVRYHYYYRDIPAGNYTWTHDFSKFPGLQIQLPGEAFVQRHTREIVMTSNDYWHYSIYISIGYIVTIFTLKFLMNQREKGFDLKRELILWNWFLATFSFMGTVRCLPEFWHVLINDGFFASYAKNTYVQVSLSFFSLIYLLFYSSLFLYVFNFSQQTGYPHQYMVLVFHHIESSGINRYIVHRIT